MENNTLKYDPWKGHITNKTDDKKEARLVIGLMMLITLSLILAYSLVVVSTDLLESQRINKELNMEVSLLGSALDSCRGGLQ